MEKAELDVSMKFQCSLTQSKNQERRGSGGKQVKERERERDTWKKEEEGR